MIAKAINAPDRKLLVANTAEKGRKLFEENLPGIVIVNQNLPDRDGLAFLKDILPGNPALKAIMIAHFADQNSLVTAIQTGVLDYLIMPMEMHMIRPIIEGVFRRLHVDPDTPVIPRTAPAAGKINIIGQSPPILRIIKLIARVAKNPAPILITGESGTGKDLVAHALHAYGTDPDNPFTVIDAGSLPASLLESELFGYERGAFTGASDTKPGRLELANGGTLFFDEIGNIPVELQGKLLRSIEDGTSQRLGSTKSRSWNARIISATNANLIDLMAEGKFRKDLYYRLAGVPIHIPPLRERISDLPLLIRHFLEKHDQSGRIKTVSLETLAMLESYPWPGNVRELESTIRNIAAVTHNREVLPEDLPDDMRIVKIPWSIESALFSGDIAADKGVLTLEQVKQRYISKVLKLCGGSKTKAAKLLDIDKRTITNLTEGSDVHNIHGRQTQMSLPPPHRA
jgi:DNA-binding NtrC family response regulator